MRKADIADEIFKQVGISKNEAADIVEFVLNLLKSVLAEGRIGQNRGVWKFCCAQQGSPKGSKSSNRRRNWDYPPSRRYVSAKPGVQEVRQFVRHASPTSSTAP